MAFQLVAVGDTCYWDPPGRQMQVSDQILAIKPDQVVLLGDVCQGSGSERVYSQLFDPSYGRLFRASNGITLTGVPGNHDRIADGHSRPFRKRFLGNTNINNPTYFAQNLNQKWMLIGLDDNHRYIREQNAWLKTTLRNNRRSANPRFVIIAWHAPRFTIGGTSVKNNTRVISWWQQIHNDPYTRILLHGHQHSFRHNTTNTGGEKFLRDIFIVGTGGGDKRRPGSRYGVLVLNLFDRGGYKASYRQIFKNYNERIGGPRGKVTDVYRRGPRRIKTIPRGGTGAVTNPAVPVPPKPKPTPPPASNPANPSVKPPPTSLRPPRPPKDPTKRSTYVEDGVLYVWG